MLQPTVRVEFTEENYLHHFTVEWGSARVPRTYDRRNEPRFLSLCKGRHIRHGDGT